MARLYDYAGKYRFVRLEREDGILTATLHSAGGPLRWGLRPHHELSAAFADIAADPENEVVVLTGTGDSFIAEVHRPGGGSEEGVLTAEEWDPVYWHGKRLLSTLLDIEVPTVAAVNGPALIHAELAVLCDIVLAAEHAEFQDAVHYVEGRVPGDGVHVVWPLLLGPNRGRYFLLTGEKLSAAEAHRLGVVAEVLPADRLLPRAMEVARQLLAVPPLTRRYARVALTQQLKRRLLDELGYGLALEGLAATRHWPT